MTQFCTQEQPAQTVLTVLRAATDLLHQALHKHPLIVQLLARPSLDAYQSVLEGFHRFYAQTEPTVVGCSRRLGFARQYPRPSRTQWLVSDLESLAFDWDQLVPLSDAHVGTRLNSVGELVGCLYVIKGSALGGRTILRQLSGSLSIERSCRFFRGEGVKTRDMWNGFQQFCDDVCRGDQRIQEAIIAAKRTFTSIEDCLTLSMNGRCWSRHNRSTNSDRSN